MELTVKNARAHKLAGAWIWQSLGRSVIFVSFWTCFDSVRGLHPPSFGLLGRVIYSDHQFRLTLGSWIRIPLESWMYGCVVFSCVGTSLAIGRSLVQVVLPKRLNVFTVSEVSSESEQAKEPYPPSVQQSIR